MTYSHLKDPVLVIIEYVRYGDLRNYLRNRRGQNDNNYNGVNIEPETSLSSLQLLLMSWQIADGMSYLSSKKVRRLPFYGIHLEVYNRFHFTFL